MNSYKAVCFDLFDTLISFDPGIYNQIRNNKIEALGLDKAEFSTLWNNSSRDALNGVFQIMSDRYRHVLYKMSDGHKARNLLPDLLQNEKNALRAAILPIPGIPEVIHELRSHKKQLAIISNASCIGPLIIETLGWENYFDEYIFSFIEKLFKPDPQIFLLASERLGQYPSNLAFVSDGNRGELTGAASAGFDTLRFDPTNSYPDQYLPPGCFSCSCTEILQNRLLMS